MSFISSIAGGLLSAHAAGSAANAEVQGAQQAQKTIETNQTNANAAQQTALTNVTAAEQPYQTLGSTSANALGTMISGGGFQAPTLAQAEADSWLSIPAAARHAGARRERGRERNTAIGEHRRRA